MPRSNVEALLHLQPKQASTLPANQPPKNGVEPTKKPRPGSGGARAPKKGQRSTRRASAAAKGDEGGDGDGDGDADGSPGGAVGGAAGAFEGERGARRVALASKGKAGVGSLEGVAGAGTSEGAAAYARVRAEIGAVPRDALYRITVNVPRAVVLVLGALPKMLALRDVMREELVNPPFALLDNLRDYALAAAYLHARVLPHDEGETKLRVLLNEAVPLRERLLSSAKTLATFGLLDARAVADVPRGAGHIDTAQGLSALSALLREAGPEIVGKTPLTPADIGRAGELGSLLLEALGCRQSGADGSGDPSEIEERLNQAYVLLSRAYDECRRVISFLRWNEGDVDTIAPPLGHSRRRARRSPAEEPGGAEPDDNGSDSSGPEPTTPGDGEAEGG